MSAPAHEVVAILASCIAAAAEEAPDRTEERAIIDVALDVALAELANRFGQEAAERIVRDGRVTGSEYTPALCDALLAFHQLTGGRI